MRVYEAMSKNVQTVPASMDLTTAAGVMRTQGIHHLVVTAGKEIVGVVSSRDLMPRRRGAAESVADAMHTDVVTIDEGETLRKAANRMRGRTIGCLPVTKNGRLAGMVTTSDLLRLIGQGGDRPAQNERATLSHRVPHRKVHDNRGRW